MRIGILTGGGDVPGLNVCIKAVVTRGHENGWEVFGIRRGWGGLLNYNLHADEPSRREWIDKLTCREVRTIDRYGGTHLHSSRTHPGKVKPSTMPDFLKSRFPFDGQKTQDCTRHVLEVLDHLKISRLIPIGGDDTLSYAARLHQEGVKIVAIPKTMDNDVFGTDYCIGFSTAVTRSVEYIHALRTPTGSHERVAVVELFGRNSGETALISGYLAGADRVLISEVPFDVEKLARLISEDRKRNPSNYAMIVISEGATLIGGQIQEYGEADAYGHKKLGGIGNMVGDALKKLAGLEVVSQQLAYLMRSGPPDSLDRMVAISYANLAVQELAAGAFGKMVALQRGVYTTVPVDTSTKGLKRVDVNELYDTDQYRPNVPRLLGKPMFLY